jgi:hypothetical protein
LNGFEVAGITELASGLPLRPVTVSTNGGRIGLYPNLIGSPAASGQLDPGTGLPFLFNPASFTPADLGTFGNAPRFIGRLPFRFNTNLALSRNIVFNERISLRLRAESSNVFNRTQFTAAGTQFGFFQFGVPTAAAPPRQMQFGARLNF